MFIAIKTDDGRIKGKISFYCKVLHVSRQAFNKFLKTKDSTVSGDEEKCQVEVEREQGKYTISTNGIIAIRKPADKSKTDHSNQNDRRKTWGISYIKISYV